MLKDVIINTYLPVVCFIIFCHECLPGKYFCKDGTPYNILRRVPKFFKSGTKRHRLTFYPQIIVNVRSTVQNKHAKLNTVPQHNNFN